MKLPKLSSESFKATCLVMGANDNLFLVLTLAPYLTQSYISSLGVKLSNSKLRDYKSITDLSVSPQSKPPLKF